MITNYSAGHEAEKVAAQFLESKGFNVLDINWKTPVCEIDIIAQKKNTMYFVEVKYRKNSNQGDGLDYITPKKLQQMRFSANCWVQENNYEGDYELSAISMSAENKVIEFIDQIDF